MDLPKAAANALRTPARGVLVFRWASVAWMAAVTATYPGGVVRPFLAWSGVAVAALWALALTRFPARTPIVVTADLALALAMVLASGLVVPPGTLGRGLAFFASAYPLAAALEWGLERGPAGGVVAGALLGAAVVASRPINGIALDALSRAELQGLGNTIVGYILGGVAVGVFSRMVGRAAADVTRATTELLRERERVARLTEREALARRIHDSALQTLSFVHKRGQQLSETAGPGVRELAEMAGREEAALRDLINAAPADARQGAASLRDALRRAATERGATFSATGALWVPARLSEEITAAVAEALKNAADHAKASTVTVFADDEDGELVVSVRDDGGGFVYDPEGLRQAGRAGLLRSVGGRIADLGGRLDVDTAPGRGTTIEMRVPLSGWTGSGS